MLVLAPAACCLAGVAVHEVLRVLMASVRQETEEEEGNVPEARKSSPAPKKGKAAGKVGLSFCMTTPLKPRKDASPCTNVCVCCNRIEPCSILYNGLFAVQFQAIRGSWPLPLQHCKGQNIKYALCVSK